MFAKWQPGRHVEVLGYVLYGMYYAGTEELDTADRSTRLKGAMAHTSASDRFLNEIAQREKSSHCSQLQLARPMRPITASTSRRQVKSIQDVHESLAAITASDTGKASTFDFLHVDPDNRPFAKAILTTARAADIHRRVESCSALSELASSAAGVTGVGIASDKSNDQNEQEFASAGPPAVADCPIWTVGLCIPPTGFYTTDAFALELRQWSDKHAVAAAAMAGESEGGGVGISSILRFDGGSSSTKDENAYSGRGKEWRPRTADPAALAGIRSRALAQGPLPALETVVKGVGLARTHVSLGQVTRHYAFPSNAPALTAVGGTASVPSPEGMAAALSEADSRLYRIKYLSGSSANAAAARAGGGPSPSTSSSSPAPPSALPSGHTYAAKAISESTGVMAQRLIERQGVRRLAAADEGLRGSALDLHLQLRHRRRHSSLISSSSSSSSVSDGSAFGSIKSSAATNGPAHVCAPDCAADPALGRLAHAVTAAAAGGSRSAAISGSGAAGGLVSPPLLPSADPWLDEGSDQEKGDVDDDDDAEEGGAGSSGSSASGGASASPPDVTIASSSSSSSSLPAASNYYYKTADMGGGRQASQATLLHILTEAFWEVTSQPGPISIMAAKQHLDAPASVQQRQSSSATLVGGRSSSGEGSQLMVTGTMLDGAPVPSLARAATIGAADATGPPTAAPEGQLFKPQMRHEGSSSSAGSSSSSAAATTLPPHQLQWATVRSAQLDLAVKLPLRQLWHQFAPPGLGGGGSGDSGDVYVRAGGTLHRVTRALNSRRPATASAAGARSRELAAQAKARHEASWVRAAAVLQAPLLTDLCAALTSLADGLVQARYAGCDVTLSRMRRGADTRAAISSTAGRTAPTTTGTTTRPPPPAGLGRLASLGATQDAADASSGAAAAAVLREAGDLDGLLLKLPLPRAPMLGGQGITNISSSSSSFAARQSAHAITLFTQLEARLLGGGASSSITAGANGKGSGGEAGRRALACTRPLVLLLAKATVEAVLRARYPHAFLLEAAFGEYVRAHGPPQPALRSQPTAMCTSNEGGYVSSSSSSGGDAPLSIGDGTDALLTLLASWRPLYVEIDGLVSGLLDPSRQGSRLPVLEADSRAHAYLAAGAKEGRRSRMRQRAAAQEEANAAGPGGDGAVIRPSTATSSIPMGNGAGSLIFASGPAAAVIAATPLTSSGTAAAAGRERRPHSRETSRTLRVIIAHQRRASLPSQPSEGPLPPHKEGAHQSANRRNSVDVTLSNLQRDMSRDPALRCAVIGSTLGKIAARYASVGARANTPQLSTALREMTQQALAPPTLSPEEEQQTPPQQPALLESTDTKDENSSGSVQQASTSSASAEVDRMLRAIVLTSAVARSPVSVFRD